MFRSAHRPGRSGLASLLVLIALAWMPAAWAAPVVKSQLQVRMVAMVSGHEVLQPVTAAKPGDLLQYRAVYSNAGDAAAGHLLANLPIPAGTTLQDSGIEPAGALASTDGNRFAPMPLLRTVTGKDGKPRQEPVPLGEIRALRWDLGVLAPHQDKSVQARVRVNAPAAAAPAEKLHATTPVRR